MATNFGTKVVIKAYRCISTRDSENVITSNRGFSWSTNPKKTFLIARFPWQPSFGQNRQKYHKKAITSIVTYDIHAEFGFGIGFVAAISEFICDIVVHKGQRGYNRLQ